MRGIERSGVLAGLAVVAGLLGACGSDNSDKRTVEDVYREVFGAYSCMPADVRRRYDPIRRRYDARSKLVIARAKGKQTLPEDPEFDRLQRQVSAMIAPYYPGGRKFDKACYDRAQERFKGQPYPD